MTGKPDIAELYGLEKVDPLVAARLSAKDCPFTNQRCSMIVRGSPNPTGVCAVTAGSSKTPVIICEDRFYGDGHATLRVVANEVFGAGKFVIGGTIEDFRRQQSGSTVMAFGEKSGGRIQLTGKGKIGFDWVLQQYQNKKRVGFVAMDVLTPKISGSYRDALEGYRIHHTGKKTLIAQSGHSIEWIDLDKTILPEIIRKATLLRTTPGCQGYFIILPDIMLDRLDELCMGDLPDQRRPYPDTISFRAYAPDRSTGAGVRLIRSSNIRTEQLIAAYHGRSDEKTSARLDQLLEKIL
jgi:hypothetical protein